MTAFWLRGPLAEVIASTELRFLSSGVRKGPGGELFLLVPGFDGGMVDRVVVRGGSSAYI